MKNPLSKILTIGLTRKNETRKSERNQESYYEDCRDRSRPVPTGSKADYFSRKSKGKQAENKACQYLQNQGLKLLARNYHSRFGEIDLIMSSQDTIIFIEVRWRNNLQFGTAQESVNWKKQQKIIKTASYYLQQEKLDSRMNCRFDVIAINNNFKIEWIKNAFELTN